MSAATPIPDQEVDRCEAVRQYSRGSSVCGRRGRPDGPAGVGGRLGSQTNSGAMNHSLRRC